MEAVNFIVTNTQSWIQYDVQSVYFAQFAINSHFYGSKTMRNKMKYGKAFTKSQ